MKRTEIRRTEIRRTASRSRPRATGPSAEVVAMVWERDRTRCAACGNWCLGPRGEGWSVHHRLARKGGGTNRPYINMPGNLVLLCGHGSVGCHAQVESERIWAEAAGFIVRDGVTLPAAVPISHAVHGLVYLTEAGGISDASPGARCPECRCDPALCESDGEHCADQSCGPCLHGCPLEACPEHREAG